MFRMDCLRAKHRLGGILLLLLLPLFACTPPDTGNPVTAAALQRVIVEFSVPPAAPGASLLAALKERSKIAAQIRSRLQPEVQKTVRIYDNLPLMALTADAKTIIDLLRMTEVSAVRPDREVAAPAFKVPSLPAGPGGK